VKSLAHPEWPYVGTSHEWRGFRDKILARETEFANEFANFVSDSLHDVGIHNSIYQKQNFGPDLK
jgi:hypothetical protein